MLSVFRSQSIIRQPIKIVLDGSILMQVPQNIHEQPIQIIPLLLFNWNIWLNNNFFLPLVEYSVLMIVSNHPAKAGCQNLSLSWYADISFSSGKNSQTVTRYSTKFQSLLNTIYFHGGIENISQPYGCSVCPFISNTKLHTPMSSYSMLMLIIPVCFDKMRRFNSHWDVLHLHIKEENPVNRHRNGQRQRHACWVMIWRR